MKLASFLGMLSLSATAMLFGTTGAHAEGEFYARIGLMGGMHKCLTHSHDKSDQKVNAADCNDSDSQLWKLIPVNKLNGEVVHIIATINSDGKCLTADDGPASHTATGIKNDATLNYRDCDSAYYFTEFTLVPKITAFGHYANVTLYSHREDIKNKVCVAVLRQDGDNFIPKNGTPVGLGRCDETKQSQAVIMKSVAH